MARHRNIRNLNLEDNEINTTDHDIAQSMEQDDIMSPTQSRFMYAGRNSQARLYDYFGQEQRDVVTPEPPHEQHHYDYDDNYYDEDDGMFDFDDVVSGSKMPSKGGNKIKTNTTKKTNFQATKVKPAKTEQKPKKVEQSKAIMQPENKVLLNLKEEDPTLTGLRPSSSNSRTPSPQRGRLNPPSIGSTGRQTPVQFKPRNRMRPDDAKVKPNISLVVIGHVDAGKSTMMGHLLKQLGEVNERQMHKMEQESKRLGKASFAYAWVLDETNDERERGVTMDVATRHFNTPNRSITLLDAPGHRDFIPNMITGAAQADACVLVINATRGEFESGFDQGGQTREHALLARAFGVTNVIVALNKIDTVDWSQNRYEEIVEILKNFLQKQAQFPGNMVRFVPISGLQGINLTKAPDSHPLGTWYKGPTLLDLIDTLPVPQHDDEKPLRLAVSSVYRGGVTGQGVSTSGGLTLTGTILQGSLAQNERVLIQPSYTMASVKQLTSVTDCSLESQSSVDEERYFDAPSEKESTIVYAGESCTMTVTGSDVPAALNMIGPGSIICHHDDHPLEPLGRIALKIMIFDLPTPLIKGYAVDVHAHSAHVAGKILKLISSIDKRTGEVISKKPRCLSSHAAGTIEIALDSLLCVEIGCKQLSRVTLRAAGKTIAAGLIIDIPKK